MTKLQSFVVLGALAVTGCKKPEAPPPPPAAPKVEEKPKFSSIERLDFNRRAVAHHLPLFWRSDANENGALEPKELAVHWTNVPVKLADYVDAKGEFTPAFADAYALLEKNQPCAGRTDDDAKRCALNVEELAQGRPTLLETDLKTLTEVERNVLAQLVVAAQGVEKLFARQKGSFGLAEKLADGDLPGRAVFWRNQGPRCAAPKTEQNPDCGALSGAEPRSGLYPGVLQQEQGFCKKLEKAKNAKQLMDHFTVVQEGPKGQLEAVPYTKAWAEDAEGVAKALENAAGLLGDDEAAFKAYLTAAANAFRTNDWEKANEAWVAMNASNSKWYLRAAPDEVYEEPCGVKAGFAVMVARIDQASVEWQNKLSPVKQDMEVALAELAGKPYAARQVAFKLPDFIQIVINAGDQRPPSGATLGQSLPNWGKVAEKGGRTMVMSNINTDVDSQNALRSQMASLFCGTTQKLASTDPQVGLMAVVLHEAAHNLGPSHDYKAGGKTDDQAFGGPLAATMEELKAQTSALFLTDWLVGKGVVSGETANQSQVRSVAWGFGHVSRGMYTADGKPKNYSQLASIQLGHLREAGALTWKPEEKAANNEDVGCFEVDLVKMRDAVAALEKTVLQIKAKNDKAGAEKLIATHVDAKDEWAQLRTVITERWLRAPKATFLYALTE